MKADKHLNPCTEKCKYNATGICAFSLRKMGCYLEPEVQKAASELLSNALTINTLERAKEIIRGEL